MDQREIPLAGAAASFLADPAVAPFMTPGHKRAPHLADDLLRLDLPLSCAHHPRLDALQVVARP